MAEFVGIGLSVAGTALGIIGEKNEAEAQAEAAEFEASRADRNSRLVIASAGLEQGIVRREGRRDIGTIRAAFSASGVTSDLSGADVIADSRAIIEANALAIRDKAILQSDSFLREAIQFRKRAKQAREGGELAAIATGVVGAANLLKRF